MKDDFGQNLSTGIAESRESEVRKQLSTMMAEAAKNETILRRAQQREIQLLESESLEELFENLVHGLAASFGLEEASIALWDPQHEIRHLLLFNDLEKALPPGVVFCDDLNALSPLYHHLKGPALGPYVSDQHRQLLPQSERLQSVAILPLRRKHQLIGSLNFGSCDAKRFTRYHATDFLGHLSLIAAYCLENNINRSKLFWTGLTDVLTGWHNRRYIDARIQEEFAAAARTSDTLSFLMFDLDHFKAVNDKYGHAAGDMVLREIALRVQKEIRISDVAARYGGEEFVVLLPRTALSDAAVLAERVRLAVAKSPVRVNSNTAITVTISIGISCASPAANASNHADPIAELLASADKAMYRAKERGRNRVELGIS